MVTKQIIVIIFLSILISSLTKAQNIFEAEDAIIFSGYVKNDYAGYSGSGYVDLADKTAATLSSFSDGQMMQLIT
jgi:hypothetical protein